MQTAGCRTLFIAAFVLLGGCAPSDLTGVPDPIAGASASRSSYAYSTPYAEMWEVDGELMPAGYGAPPAALIFGSTSSIDWSLNCGSTCDVSFQAYMTGLWHATTQTIHWQVDGRGNAESKTNYGWSCAWRISLLNCGMAQRSDVHKVRVQHCKWSAQVHSDHAAWWLSWYDASAGEKKPGPAGRISESSFGHDRAVDLCPGDSDPWSGEPGGSGVCYDAYLVWTDVAGYHEEYLGTWCYGGWAT